MFEMNVILKVHVPFTATPEDVARALAIQLSVGAAVMNGNERGNKTQPVQVVEVEAYTTSQKHTVML